MSLHARILLLQNPLGLIIKCFSFFKISNRVPTQYGKICNFILSIFPVWIRVEKYVSTLLLLFCFLRYKIHVFRVAAKVFTTV